MRLGAALVIVTLALSSGARAADPKDEARAHLVEGARLLKAKKHEAALAEFESAYALVPSPKIHYNFGLAYQALGRDVDALTSFERFLTEVADPPRDARTAAEKARAELTKRVGRIEVASSRTDADVKVDGRVVGKTPLRSPIFVEPGAHDVSVTTATGATHSERVAVSAGATIRVDANPAEAATAARLEPAPPPEDPGARAAEKVAEPDVAVRSSTGTSWRRTGAIASAVGAAALLGFGVYQQVQSASKFDQFNTQKVDTNPSMGCWKSLPQRGGPLCNELYASGENAQRKALVGFIGAGVLGATSALLFFVGGGDGDATRVAGLPCAPTVGPGALGCVGRF